MDYNKTFQLNILDYYYFQGKQWTAYKSFDPFWRLYWHPPKSKGSIRLDKELLTILSNKLYLIAPYTPFIGTTSGYFRQFYIHFTAGWPFNLITSKIYILPAKLKNKDIIKRIIPDINKSSNIVNQKMDCLRLCISSLSSIPDKDITALSVDKRINIADSYMNQNIHRSIKNEELARAVNMSTNAFAHLFKESTGLSLHCYFMRKKIERACSMLLYPNNTIEFIAESLGFCDRYHLSKHFKSICNIGPAEYRKVGRLTYK